jgi:hypothetical protein
VHLRLVKDFYAYMKIFQYSKNCPILQTTIHGMTIRVDQGLINTRTGVLETKLLGVPYPDYVNPPPWKTWCSSLLATIEIGTHRASGLDSSALPTDCFPRLSCRIYGHWSNVVNSLFADSDSFMLSSTEYPSASTNTSCSWCWRWKMTIRAVFLLGAWWRGSVSSTSLIFLLRSRCKDQKILMTSTQLWSLMHSYHGLRSHR